MRLLLRWLAGVQLGLAVALSCAQAVQPDEMLQNPVLEGRARRLSQELRCLVCQNQSIDDSNAELARDLRVLVRERLSAGDTDRQVLAYISSRYGEFVLLRPPLKLHTLILWLAPFLLLAFPALLLVRRWRTPPAADRGLLTAPLSAEEQQRLERILRAPKC